VARSCRHMESGVNCPVCPSGVVVRDNICTSRWMHETTVALCPRQTRCQSCSRVVERVMSAQYMYRVVPCVTTWCSHNSHRDAYVVLPIISLCVVHGEGEKLASSVSRAIVSPALPVTTLRSLLTRPAGQEVLTADCSNRSEPPKKKAWCRRLQRLSSGEGDGMYHRPHSRPVSGNTG